jgi:hypothetical protein
MPLDVDHLSLSSTFFDPADLYTSPDSKPVMIRFRT